MIALPDHALLKRLLASGDDTRAHKAIAQVPESDDPELSIGLAARRWPPSWDLIGLGQVPGAALPRFRLKGTF